MKTRYVAVAALLGVSVGIGVGYRWGSRDTSPVDLSEIIAERDALTDKLAAERRANAAALAEADAKADALGKVASEYAAAAAHHRERARAIDASPIETGKELDLRIARLFPNTKKIGEGYFFSAADAGQAVRWAEMYPLCVDEGRALAGEALSLREQVDAMAVARASRDADILALEENLQARDALLERGRYAYDAEVGKCRRALRRERWAKRGWMLAAGAALAGGAYLSGQ